MYVTGSTIERTELCPPSAVLRPPSVADEPPGEAARRGTAIHMYIERMSLISRTGELTCPCTADADMSYGDFFDRLDLRSLPLFAEHEVAFAYDWRRRTARRLGRGLGRRYGSVGISEIPLTVDAFCFADDGVTVWDYKTGHTPVTEAARNPQILLGALAGTKAYETDKAVGEIVYIREDGSVTKDRATFTADDLDSFALRVYSTMQAVDRVKETLRQGKMPRVYTGEHCRYCKAFDHCPAQKELALATIDGAMEKRLESCLASITPANAADVYQRLRMIAPVLAKIRARVYAIAGERPIDLGNGRKLGIVEKRGNEKLDGAIAKGVLTSMCGSAVADAATSITVTKAAIRTALRAIGGDAKSERTVLDAIREAGGSQRSMRTVIEEHDG